MSADSNTFLAAVTKDLESIKIGPGNEAIALLAKQYAVTIDLERLSGDTYTVLGTLGPKLQAALSALGLTPEARRRNGGTPDGTGPTAAADELARLRAERVSASGGRSAR